MDKICYKLEGFEGPLDLLLHLIKQEEIEITIVSEMKRALENGEFKITFTPEERKPVTEYLSKQKRFRHLNEEHIEKIQKYVDAECKELGL